MVLETPTEEGSVSRWNQDSRSSERLGGGDQGLKVRFRFCNGVAEEAEQSGITSNAASTADHQPLLDSVLEFTRAVMTMHALAHVAARLNTLDTRLHRPALEARPASE